jgi:hypothetical protein
MNKWKWSVFLKNRQLMRLFKKKLVLFPFKPSGPIIEVFIQIVKGTDQEPKQDSNKLLAFHLYPTIFVITVQGNLHSY